MRNAYKTSAGEREEKRPVLEMGSEGVKYV
jgi:hypothetical protein